jgi:hypothetical protein
VVFSKISLIKLDYYTTNASIIAWFKRISRLTILAVALMLGATFNVASAQVLSQQSSSSLARELENAFRPPPRGLPVNSQGAAFGGGCLVTHQSLTALVPDYLAGQTSAEYPTVFWYMPRMRERDGAAPAPAMEFTLKDANGHKIHSAMYPLSKSADGSIGTPGIMSLILAKPYALKVGQEYNWDLRVTCDAKSPDRSSDHFVEGGIKRVALNPNLARRLQQATPEERLVLYARAKLWYEMLAELVKLRRDRPDDPNLAYAWEKLFVAVGLDRVSKVPIITNNP